LIPPQDRDASFIAPQACLGQNLVEHSMSDHDLTHGKQPESNRLGRAPTAEELRQWIQLSEMIRGQLERRPLQGVLDQELTAHFRGAAVRGFMKGVRQDWEAFSVFNPEAAEALYRADEELRVLLQLVGADLPDHFQDYFGSPDQPADKAKAQTADQARPTEPTKVPRAEPTTDCLIPPRNV